MRVLVVEDEPVLAEAIALGLRREGLAVDLSLDGGSALEKLAVNSYDVLVLDRDLPVVHGDSLLRQVIAEQPDLAVLMVTAAAEVADRVDGLRMGADDYLPKPFAFAELVARVQSLGRRTRPVGAPTLRRAGLMVDPARHSVLRDGARISLSAKELGILEELLRADGAFVTAEQLLERVWDEHIDPFTNVVRVTVQTLRRKLGDPDPIETKRRVGYRIE